jgi:hypothetical protein
MASFTKAELAFFVVPRRWIPAIVARFGDDSDVRDKIIQLDSDGGMGLLIWVKKQKSWVLTDKGKRWAGDRLLAREARWEPNAEEKVRWDKALARAAEKAARGEDQGDDDYDPEKRKADTRVSVDEEEDEFDDE